METYSLSCKNCGAPLSVAKSAREATCSHCGTKVGIKATKDEPEIIILDSRKPPIQKVKTRKVEPGYDPAEQRRKEEEEQVRIVRHGANLLDAVTGYRSCLNVIMIFTVLGGVLTCGLCGLPGVMRWASRSRDPRNLPTGIMTVREDRTDDMLSIAARVINTRAHADAQLPSSALGNELIDRYRDEWDHGLRYEQNSSSTFVIRSGGADGVFDTTDDRIEQQRSSSVRDPSQAAEAPADLEAAIVQLRIPGLYQKQAALKWLIAKKPELDETQRNTIVDSVIPLLRISGQRPLARNTMTLWANESDAPKLLQSVERTNPRESDYLDTLVTQLIRLRNEDALIPLINYPSNSVRASVLVATNDWKVSEERIVAQCLQDLDREQYAVAALTRLRLMELHAKQRADVASRTKQLLMESEATSHSGLLAYDLLEHLDAIDVRLLTKVYGNHSEFRGESDLRDRAALELTQHPETSVFLLFASQLASRDRQVAERGATHLKLMGPAAESFVWPYLRSENGAERERACNVLASIGTELSVPHLMTIDVNESARAAADAAILDIQNAKRQPVVDPRDATATPAPPVDLPEDLPPDDLP